MMTQDTDLPDLQVPVRVSEMRRNVQLKFLGEQLQRSAQIKAYKRQKELENMEQGSTSSPPPPEPFLEPSADADAPDAHIDNIEQTSSPSQASNSFIAPIVPWSNMGLFLYDIGQRIEKMSSDGHCLMYAIMQALKLDHDIHIDHRTIANRIWKEINKRIVFYVHFICGKRKNRMMF